MQNPGRCRRHRQPRRTSPCRASLHSIHGGLDGRRGGFACTTIAASGGPTGSRRAGGMSTASPGRAQANAARRHPATRVHRPGERIGGRVEARHDVAGSHLRSGPPNRIATHESHNPAVGRGAVPRPAWIAVVEQGRGRARGGAGGHQGPHANRHSNRARLPAGVERGARPESCRAGAPLRCRACEK